ncbi:MAG TPA: SoxR reducing system RseC family protein [bacterium]|nr:SoxR reducing system RseC family protein [bacterium]
MPQETGRVIERKNKTRVIVETIRSEACHGCSAQGMCHSMGGSKKMRVEAINRIGADPGDTVIIEISDRAFLSGSFIIFFLPVLALVAGILIGGRLSPLTGWSAETTALVAGFGLFVLVTACSIYFGNRYAETNTAFVPTITSIERRADDPAAEQPGCDQ